jgi:hypothetical protein
MINVFPAVQNFEVGRSESLEVSLTTERLPRELSEIQLIKLMQLYFFEKIKSICVNKKNNVWYRGFEIHLWEAINGHSDVLDLSKEEIISLINISEHLSIWVINPSDWLGFEKRTKPFIPLKAWKQLHENKEKLFKPSHEQQHSP